MGVGMRAAVRSQINLVMAEMEHVAALKGVRDIIYPIMWFQVKIIIFFHPTEPAQMPQMSISTSRLTVLRYILFYLLHPQVISFVEVNQEIILAWSFFQVIIQAQHPRISSVWDP